MTKYKEKLNALLEGLECENIKELMEKSSEFLKRVGEEITNSYKKKDNVCLIKCNTHNDIITCECGEDNIVTVKTVKDSWFKFNEIVSPKVCPNCKRKIEFK